MFAALLPSPNPIQVQLHPVSPPVAVLPNYIQQQSVTLVMKEKPFSFSGDDFAITDTKGVPVVRCEGKAFSFRGAKCIADSNHNPLFVLKNKMMAIPKVFIAEDPKGKEMFRVKKHFGMGTKMTALFTNAVTGQPGQLSIKGDMFGLQATVMLDETIPVATISRQMLEVTDFFLGKQTYFVTVSPGVDLALIAAICICFDEAKNDG